MKPIDDRAQLRLALRIITGRVTLLKPGDDELLSLLPEEDVNDWNVVQDAAEDILIEYLSVLIPPPTVDRWEIAINLLKQIQEAGGTLDTRITPVDEEIIAALVEDGVILKGLTGLRWGKNATRAIDDWNSSQQQDETKA